MEKYHLEQNSDSIFNTETQHLIPDDSKNRHWIEYQTWLKEGNDPVPCPPMTDEVQAIIDKRVAARNWGHNLPTLATITTADGEEWVESSVSDVASAKAALKIVVKALIYLRDRT